MTRALAAPADSTVAVVDTEAVDDAMAQVRSNTTRERYEEVVELAKEDIRAGEVFQVVLSQRFSMDCAADPVDVYRALRASNPSPYMYLFRLPHPDGSSYSVVGSSPEALVRVTGERAITHPIAGSRPRGKTPEDDVDLAEELLADPKERAEHVMLVDLGRNDLQRVCRPGTRRRRRVHGRAPLQPRHAHRVHRRRRHPAGRQRLRRAGRRRSPRAPSPVRPSPVRSPSSSSTSPPGAACTAASSATSTSTATSTWPSRSAPRSSRTASPTCRPVPASSPTRCPPASSRSACTRPTAALRAVATAGAMRTVAVRRLSSKGVVVLLALVGAGLLLVSAFRPWVTGAVDDAVLGATRISATGAEVAPGLSAVALAIGAAAIAIVAAGRIARIVAVVAYALCVAVARRPRRARAARPRGGARTGRGLTGGSYRVGRHRDAVGGEHGLGLGLGQHRRSGGGGIAHDGARRLLGDTRRLRLSWRRPHQRVLRLGVLPKIEESP